MENGCLRGDGDGAARPEMDFGASWSWRCSCVCVCVSKGHALAIARGKHLEPAAARGSGRPWRKEGATKERHDGGDEHEQGGQDTEKRPSAQREMDRTRASI